MPKRKSRKLRRSRKSKRKSLRKSRKSRKSRRRKRRRRKRSRRGGLGDCTVCTGASYGQNDYGPKCLNCRKEKYEKLLKNIEVKDGIIDLKTFFQKHMEGETSDIDHTGSRYTIQASKYDVMKSSTDGKQIAENILQSVYDLMVKTMRERNVKMQQIFEESVLPIREIKLKETSRSLHEQFEKDLVKKLNA